MALNDHTDSIGQHEIMLPAVLTGGYVEAGAASAEEGSDITLTIVPDPGYRLDELAVEGETGELIPAYSRGSGIFSFRMPDHSVSVSASFVLEQDTKIGWQSPFRDISETAWYFDAVRFVQTNGIMNGISQSVFAPDSTLTRGMFAMILYNKEGLPGGGSKSFADVQEGAWYASAISWAVSRDIVSGYGGGRFGPDDPITREQLALMLWRYSGRPEVLDDVTSAFQDAEEISSFARDALSWAIGNGVISGKGSGILDPKGQATRAEAAQMLKN